MSQDDGIWLEVSILNKTWTFRGFDAIRDLAEWMDNNASDSWAPQPVATATTDAPVPESGPL